MRYPIKLNQIFSYKFAKYFPSKADILQEPSKLIKKY